MWNNPLSVSTDWLCKKVVLNLKDVFIQTWSQQCRDCTKACNYFLYKTTFGTEHYLDNLPKSQRTFLTKIRTSNHKLPIEKGTYNNIPREQRICNLCTLGCVDDEFHFLLECPFFSDLRKVHIPKYYYNHPNYFKYSKLLLMKGNKKLQNMSKFVKQ